MTDGSDHIRTPDDDKKVEHTVFSGVSSGVGFVARIDAVPYHSVVVNAVELLRNLDYRPEEAPPSSINDGAGMMLQIPDTLIRHDAHERGVALPDPGDYALAMVFFASR